MKQDLLSISITSRLDKLLNLAKEQGLSQKDLAARAGISAVGLSQAKSRGDLRVSTLEALANALDMTIDFVPRHSRQSAIQSIRGGRFLRLGEEEQA